MLGGTSNFTGMLHPDEFRTYCLAKAGVTEEMPFGPDTLVFKVMGKIFALAPLDSDVFSINLKYPSDDIEELRSRHPAVIPGYHMHKAHWNTVIIDGSMPVKELLALIDISYELIVNNLPKKLQAQLKSA